MDIENWPEDVVLVTLPPEPKLADEVNKAIQSMSEKGSRDTVVDFSEVEIITTPSLSALVKLRKLLANGNQQLICCNVAPQIKGIFTVSGLDTIIEFADNKSSALDILQPQHTN
jgi:anti-anti-sigma factor